MKSLKSVWSGDWRRKYCEGHDRISNPDTVFSDDSQDKLFKIEADSWWFQYRSAVIVGFMNRFFQRDVVAVDLGGGNGYTTSVAARKGFKMLLLEPSEEACRNGRKRGLKTCCSMMTDEYPKDGSFEQVLLLDVLEHIEDDEGFLRLLNRKLHGGVLFLLHVLHSCAYGAVKMITQDIFVDTG